MVYPGHLGHGVRCPVIEDVGYGYLCSHVPSGLSQTPRTNGLDAARTRLNLQHFCHTYGVLKIKQKERDYERER